MVNRRILVLMAVHPADEEPLMCCRWGSVNAIPRPDSSLPLCRCAFTSSACWSCFITSGRNMDELWLAGEASLINMVCVRVWREFISMRLIWTLIVERSHVLYGKWGMFCGMEIKGIICGNRDIPLAYYRPFVSARHVHCAWVSIIYWSLLKYRTDSF